MERIGASAPVLVTETTNWDGDGCAMSLVAAFFREPRALVGDGDPPECVAARGFPVFPTP